MHKITFTPPEALIPVIRVLRKNLDLTLSEGIAVARMGEVEVRDEQVFPLSSQLFPLVSNLKAIGMTPDSVTPKEATDRLQKAYHSLFVKLISRVTKGIEWLERHC